MTEKAKRTGLIIAGILLCAALAVGCVWAVSYTHLTLPTNREV